jgi:hypothetical protein
MKKIIAVFLFFVASSFGAFANEVPTQGCNLVYEGLSANNLQVSNFFEASSFDELSIVCGFSGVVTDRRTGEVVGHWYSSCVHAQPTIIIVWCEEE